MSLDRKLDKVEKNVEGNVIQSKDLTKMGNSLQNQEIILIVKCSISGVKTLYHIFGNPEFLTLFVIKHINITYN
ncbi:hypothetical protein UQ64_02660 [Paenibacillus etheri]|uniref:Uncharacterized protein n=1 Tax=Paenibacillus etheri TaxID=1306852 RepID=A0A0W1APZ8_9BACL|nr:hypothetical protein UQ64_02660 [Paenibacillus etheri]